MPHDVSRRELLAAAAALGIGSATFQRSVAAVAASQPKGEAVTAEMVKNAEWVAGVTLSDDERKAVASGLTNTRQRVAALHKCHQLWGILLSSLTDSVHPMPVELRARLASLGLWAQRECFARMSDAASLEPLMAIHRDMIEALSARPAPPSPAVAAEAPPARFVPALA